MPHATAGARAAPGAARKRSGREAYLKFNLADVASVGTAALRLYGKIDSSTERPTVGVYGASDPSWSESGLTWDNRPAAGSTQLSSATVAASAYKWYEWDVTAHLQAQKAAGATSATLVVRPLTGSDPYMIFSSDEASANRPALEITPA